MADRKTLLPAFLWGTQFLVFLAFNAFGFMKLLMPISTLAAMWTWPGQVSPAFLRTLGAIDIAGGMGVLLPSASGIRPRLSIVAAICCLVLQFLAVAFHASRGELGALPLNFALIGLLLFIAWGRTRAGPLAKAPAED